MPRVPNHQIQDDEVEDNEEFEIVDDNEPRQGRRPAREDLDWEERRRDMLRKRNRNGD